MLPIILFIFYFFLLLSAFHIWLKSKKIDFPPQMATAAFAFKVFMGCSYGYIFSKYYHGDDTWIYHKESLVQYHKLVHDPISFLKDFLPYSAFRASRSFGQGIQFYIQDLEFYAMTKLLAVFNIFSRGNYYINVIFFDFICIQGLRLLYQMVVGSFHNKKHLLVLVLFFLPLSTFWISGIRAEGLLLIFISVMIYYLHRYITHEKKLAYLIRVAAAMAGCIIFRGQMFLLLLPPICCLVLSWKKPGNSLRYFITTYTAGAFIFAASTFLFPNKNLSSGIVSRQQEFFKLHGNTAYALDSLQPSTISFIKVFPQAIANGFFRPLPWEARGVLQILTALDVLLFLLLGMVSLFFHEKPILNYYRDPLLLFFIFFGITQMVFIGYVVPFPGAIVRYKSIPELLVLLTFIILTDFKRLRNFFIRRTASKNTI